MLAVCAGQQCLLALWHPSVKTESGSEDLALPCHRPENTSPRACWQQQRAELDLAPAQAATGAGSDQRSHSRQADGQEFGAFCLSSRRPTMA